MPDDSLKPRPFVHRARLLSQAAGVSVTLVGALFVLSLGILARSIDRGFISIVGDEDTAGMMTRRLHSKQLNVMPSLKRNL